MNGQESSTIEKAKAVRRLNVPLFCFVGLLGCGMIALVIHKVLFKHQVVQAMVSEDQSTLVVFSAHQDWNGSSEHLTAWNLNTGQRVSYPIDFLGEVDEFSPLATSLSDDGTKLLLRSSVDAVNLLDVSTGKFTPLGKLLSWFNMVRWIENDSKLLVWDHGKQGYCKYEISTDETNLVDGISMATPSKWLSDQIVFNGGHFYRGEGTRFQRISETKRVGSYPVSCSPDETLILEQPSNFPVFSAIVIDITDGSAKSARPLTAVDIEFVEFASNSELVAIDNGQAMLIPINTMQPTHLIDFDTDNAAHKSYLLKRKQLLRVSDSGVVSAHGWKGDTQTIGRTFQHQYRVLWLSLMAVLVWWIGWTKLVPPNRVSVTNWIPVLGFTLAIAALAKSLAQIQIHDHPYFNVQLLFAQLSRNQSDFSSLLGAVAALSAVLMTRFVLGKDRWSLAIGWSVLFVAALWGFMLWVMHDQFSEETLSQFQFNVAVALIVFFQIGFLALPYALRFRFWHSDDEAVSEQRSRQVRLSDLFLWTVGFAAMFLIGSAVRRKAMVADELANLAINGLIISAPVVTFIVLMLAVHVWQRIAILVVCCTAIAAATTIAPKSFWMYNSFSVTTVVLTGQVVFIAAAWSLRRAGYRLIRTKRSRPGVE